MSSVPVFFNTSVLVRVWPGGTITSSELGVTSARGVFSAKLTVVVLSSVTVACWVCVS